MTIPSPLEAEPGSGSRYAVATLHKSGDVLLHGEGWLRLEPGACLLEEAEAQKVVGWEAKGGAVLKLRNGGRLDAHGRSPSR